MMRMVFGKVMWVGRATVFLVGLAVILALTVGVVSRAAAHTGSAGLFHLGHNNPVRAVSTLAGGVANSVLNVSNTSTATTATAVGATNKSAVSPAVRATNSGGGPALGLSVGAGKAPMTVSGGAAKVANLDADKVDGKEASEFANAAHAHSGADITSGTVAEARIDGAVSRDNEVMGTVKAADGAGSGLDADLLDNKDSSEFLGKTEKAADADKLDGKDSSELAPRGYAQVATHRSDFLEPGRSKGIIGIQRTTPVGSTTESVYCFDLTFTPHTAVASPFLNNNAVVGTVTPPNSLLNSICTAPYNDAAARTFAANTSADLSDINFGITFM